MNTMYVCNKYTTGNFLIFLTAGTKGIQSWLHHLDWQYFIQCVHVVYCSWFTFISGCCFCRPQFTGIADKGRPKESSPADPLYFPQIHELIVTDSWGTWSLFSYFAGSMGQHVFCYEVWNWKVDRVRSFKPQVKVEGLFTIRRGSFWLFTFCELMKCNQAMAYEKVWLQLGLSKVCL